MSRKSTTTKEKFRHKWVNFIFVGLFIRFSVVKYKNFHGTESTLPIIRIRFEILPQSLQFIY